MVENSPWLDAAKAINNALITIWKHKVVAWGPYTTIRIAGNINNQSFIDEIEFHPSCVEFWRSNYIDPEYRHSIPQSPYTDSANAADVALERDHLITRSIVMTKSISIESPHLMEHMERWLAERNTSLDHEKLYGTIDLFRTMHQR